MTQCKREWWWAPLGDDQRPISIPPPKKKQFLLNFIFFYFLLLLFLSNDTKKSERIDSRPDLSRSNQRVCAPPQQQQSSIATPPIFLGKSLQNNSGTKTRQRRVCLLQNKKKQKNKTNKPKQTSVFIFFFVWISILRDRNFSCDNPMRIIITEFYKGLVFFLFTGFALLNYGPPFNNNHKKRSAFTYETNWPIPHTPGVSKNIIQIKIKSPFAHLIYKLYD